MRRPRPLPPGGTVGIVSPASTPDLALLDAGIAVLENLGFRVRVAPHARDRHGHMAGTDSTRAEDFQLFYTDPDIDIVWCARGGSSSCRLWPFLNWATLAAAPPKYVVGYSDITSLHVPLNQCAGVATLHAPMVSELAHFTPPESLAWLLRLLQSTQPAGLVPGRAAETLVSGEAEGALCGGCLSLVAATLGTPYQIDATDKLLFLEDIDEAPHRVERYLVQLREAGVLHSAAGFVIGEATGADDRDTLPLRTIWQEFLAPCEKPAVLGFPTGHVTPHYALPLGVCARLEADNRTLTLLEAAAQ